MKGCHSGLKQLVKKLLHDFAHKQHVFHNTLKQADSELYLLKHAAIDASLYSFLVLATCIPTCLAVAVHIHSAYTGRTFMHVLYPQVLCLG